MEPFPFFFSVIFLVLPQATAAEDSLMSAPGAAAGKSDSVAASRPAVKLLDSMVVRPAVSGRDSGINRFNSVNFSSQEIKTSAGAAEDVSRYLGTLPSVVSSLGAKFDNTLYVRGGSPSEITFFVDGIELENINHFSQPDGSGGPIGFINSDYIRSVRFYTGDIPVSYPPKMSSVADIDMKNGSFSSVHGEAGIKLTGGLASIEGPAFSGVGSYVFAGRYIDFSALRSLIGDDGIPRFGDLYGKLALFPLNNLAVSATGIFSYNIYKYAYPVVGQGDDGSVHGNNIAMAEKILQGGAGLLVRFKDGTWEHRFQVSYSRRKGWSFDSLEFFADSFYTSRYAKNPISGNGDDRSHISLNTNSELEIGTHQTLSAGVRAYNTRYVFSTSNEERNNGTCVICQNDSPVTLARQILPVEKALDIEGAESGVFAGHELRLGSFSSSIGLRADYFHLIGDWAFSPRFGGMVTFGGAGAISGGLGLYQQFPTDLPTILFNVLSANAAMSADSIRHAELSLLQQAVPLRCWEGTLGYHVTPWELFTSSCAFYYKWYDREYRYVAPDVQDVVYTKDDGGIGLTPQNGRRRAYGVEVSLVNARRGWLSYSLGASLFSVKNRFNNAAWYNDWTDVGYTVSCAVAASAGRGHTVSLSLQGSGGRPYCPEAVLSDCVGRKSAVIDSAQAYYSKRLDPLLSTNVRYAFTKKVFGAEVESFVEIINLFNYKPVLEYEFNGTGFQPVTPFGITPIIGCTARF